MISLRNLIITFGFLVSFSINASIITLSTEGQGRYFAEDNANYETISVMLEIILDTSSYVKNFIESRDSSGFVNNEVTEYTDLHMKVNLTSNYFDKSYFIEDGLAVIDLGTGSNEPYTAIFFKGNVDDHIEAFDFNFLMFLNKASEIENKSLDNVRLYQEPWDYINPRIAINECPVDSQNPIDCLDSLWTEKNRRNAPNFILRSIINDSLKVNKVAEPQPLAMFAIFVLFCLKRRTI